MQQLETLIERLEKDINSIPWTDRGISPTHLKTSVQFFIKAFANNAIEIVGEKNAKKRMD